MILLCGDARPHKSQLYSASSPVTFCSAQLPHKTQLTLLPSLKSLLDSTSPLGKSSVTTVGLPFLPFWLSVEPHTLWAELYYSHLNPVTYTTYGVWLSLGCLFAQLFSPHCSRVLRSWMMIIEFLSLVYRKLVRHFIGPLKLSGNTAPWIGDLSPFPEMGSARENPCPPRQ